MEEMNRTSDWGWAVRGDMLTPWHCRVLTELQAPIITFRTGTCLVRALGYQKMSLALRLLLEGQYQPC